MMDIHGENPEDSEMMMMINSLLHDWWLGREDDDEKMMTIINCKSFDHRGHYHTHRL